MCLARCDPTCPPTSDPQLGKYLTVSDRVLLRFSHLDSLSLLPAFQVDFASRPPVMDSGAEGEYNGKQVMADILATESGKVSCCCFWDCVLCVSFVF